MMITLAPHCSLTGMFTQSSTVYVHPNTYPTIWNESLISLFLMFLSSGDELLSEGDTFTSSSHGLRWASRRTSKPNTSKHCWVLFEKN